MACAAKSLLGVTCLELAQHSNTEAASETASGKAKHVIYLYMNGGMSHLDTFDPKPGTDSQGETGVTQTRIPSVSISDKLPRLAYLSNELAIVRSLTTETGAHEQGKYLMHTSYKVLNSIRHPGLGAWASHVLGKDNKNLPTNVLVGSAAGHPGAGFLPAALAPVPISNAAKGLENTQTPTYLQDGQFERRLGLARQFDASFRADYDSLLIDAYDQTYREATRLMNSADLKAFDIASEPENVREFYGDNAFGQGCLLARRLVEAGVRFIEVEFGGWDHHQDIFQKCPEMTANLDTACGALIRDLQSKGMLKEVLVVIATEFGRTPKVNENAGRDHHPAVFSGVLCGAGIRGGQVYGQSDASGTSVEESPVYPEDFNATIAAAMGLPIQQEFFAPNNRPFRICNNGEPIRELLS